MSASLVGSEMCIRDSFRAVQAFAGVAGRCSGGLVVLAGAIGAAAGSGSADADLATDEVGAQPRLAE
eukprot:5046670-Alexandrium_andersonii.AAC.1